MGKFCGCKPSIPETDCKLVFLLQINGELEQEKANGNILRNQLNLETDKLSTIQTELDQERVNVNAINIELAKEKATVGDIKTDFERQKAALDHEISCHSTTKRLV